MKAVVAKKDAEIPKKLEEFRSVIFDCDCKFVLNIKRYHEVLEHYGLSNEWWVGFFNFVTPEVILETMDFITEAAQNMLVALRRKLKEFSTGGKYENWKTDPQFQLITQSNKINSFHFHQSFEIKLEKYFIIIFCLRHHSTFGRWRTWVCCSEILSATWSKYGC